MTKIISNYHPRELVHGGMVPMRLFNNEFDYIKVCSEEFNESRFFEYGGEWYDTGQFMRITTESTNPCAHIVEESNPLLFWDGISHNTYDSGILVKLLEDDMILVGRFY